MDLQIVHETDHTRFVARTAHGEATLKYAQSDPNTLDYKSTFVPESDRGKGIGEALVLHALDWAQENGFQVIPSCPFVQSVLAEHPERAKVTAG